MKTFKFQGEEYQVLIHSISQSMGSCYMKAFRIDSGFVDLIRVTYMFNEYVTEVDRIQIAEWHFEEIKNALVAANNESTTEKNVVTDIVPQGGQKYEPQAV